jgi:hypothetical protein
MKVILLVLPAVFFVGCDLDKMTQLTPDPTPAPARSDTAATPTPVPKQGDWMWKKYQNPLDPNKKK